MGDRGSSGRRLPPTFVARRAQRTPSLSGLLPHGTAGSRTVVATSCLPDLHYFRGSFGGRHIIPLWRDAAGHSPNVPDGLLPTLGEALGQPVSAEDLFAYCYAILAGPAYARTFAEALTIPGPRIPFTRNPKLFDEAVALGRELLFLHTYGERFVSKHQRSGRIPSGAAKCAKGVSGDTSEYPNSFSYDAATQVLVVGDGRFTKVAPDVYGFEVSGYRVVQRWLAGRMRDRSGKRTSPLDDIRPEHWTFDDDLLSLLWVLEHTVARYPQHASLLERIIASKHVTSVEMEAPTFAERAGPRPSRRGNTVQETLNL